MIRGVYSKELENGLTAEEVRQLEKCPDCFGRGDLSTPARNRNNKVKCRLCHGTGLVRKDQPHGR